MLTILAYSDAASFAFVVLDDPAYLTLSREVRRGLTADSVAWAFTSVHNCNYHPLTTLSYLAEASLFGVDNPRPYHVTNIALHVAAVLALFLVAQTMTAAAWRSAFVAGLFALHPLNVESVAWVSQRKDVLSALFMFLTVAAYVSYARSGGWRRYALVCGCFALGLMSKPMLVTLPIVLLLLDYWPLARIESPPAPPAHFSPARALRLRTLLLQKLPLLLMSLISAVVTFIAQRHCGAVASVEAVPLAARAANAVVACFRYLAHMLWPAHLVPLYPLETDLLHPPLSLWPLASIGLLVITVAVFILRRRLPYLLVGWLWYLAMLVPVIGIVQVGRQAIADRYTYLPLCGIFIALTWAAADAAARFRFGRRIAAIAGLAILITCAVLTRQQAAHWRDSETLFRHALRHGRDNAAVRFSLGEAYREQRRFDEAIEQYEAALRLEPSHLEAMTALPLLLMRTPGDEANAEALTFRALGLIESARHADPSPQLRALHARALRNLGLIQLKDGNLAEAERHLRGAAHFDPHDADARLALATVLLRQKKLDEADDLLSGILRDESEHSAALVQLGTLHLARNDTEEAIQVIGRAVALDPDDGEAAYQLGVALLRARKQSEGARQLARAADMNPQDPRPHFQLGLSAQLKGDLAAAVSHYRAAHQRDPRGAASNNLAWLLATASDSRIRNGQEAVAIAAQLLQGSRARPDVLDTLAAAYAAAGDFDRAVETGAAAAEAAANAGDEALAQRIRARVALYQRKRPYLEE